MSDTTAGESTDDGDSAIGGVGSYAFVSSFVGVQKLVKWLTEEQNFHVYDWVQLA